eukprot:6353786-Pyramimonas_sp.AAC.1
MSAAELTGDPHSKMKCCPRESCEARVMEAVRLRRGFHVDPVMVSRQLQGSEAIDFGQNMPGQVVES